MAYADVKARLVVHAQTASAALARPFEDVQAGIAYPKGRCVRVYYGGEADTERQGGRYTANSEMVAKVTFITAFWPLTALDEEQFALIDAEAEAFSHALRTAVDGDEGLNGQADNATLGYGEPGESIVGNTRYLNILWPVTTDYIEYAIVR